MVRGPKKGSKRYTCRNEACEKFGRIQYLTPWADKKCRHCGSENIEEVTSRVGEKPTAPTPPPPGLAAPQEPPTTLQEPPVPPAVEKPKVEEEEDKTAPPAAPEPQTVTVVKPNNGDLVACKKCGWAVFWNKEYHTKVMCHAAGCGSSNIEIKMPVEGK